MTKNIFRCFIFTVALLILSSYPTNACETLVDTGQDRGYALPFGEDGEYQGTEHSYSKIGPNGIMLPDAAPKWAVVRDNVTGLYWEVKSVSDGIADYSNPHDIDNTYFWYDQNPYENGGDAGFGNGGNDTEECLNKMNEAIYGAFLIGACRPQLNLCYLESIKTLNIQPPTRTIFRISPLTIVTIGVPAAQNMKKMMPGA